MTFSSFASSPEDCLIGVIYRGVLVFSLKGVVKLCKPCNIAFSGASADKPSSAHVKRFLKCFSFFQACLFSFPEE